MIPSQLSGLQVGFEIDDGLYEVHRFRNAVEACVTRCTLLSESNDHVNQVAQDAMAKRCTWVLNHPDIVAAMHAIRVELLVENVMCDVVEWGGGV